MIFDADPRADVTVTASPDRVVLRGRVVTPGQAGSATP